MVSIINSFLYVIDLFGRPVTINFSGRDKFKSKFGGVCSLLFFGYIVWVLITSSSDLFSKQNPNTVTSQTYMEDPRELTISSQTFPIGIGIQAPLSMNLTPFINESIYTVDFVYARTQRTIHANGTVEEKTDRTVLAKEACTPEHFGEQAEAYAKIQLDTTYCIAKEQPEIKNVRIQGVYASLLYEHIIVYVTMCNNVTTGDKCATLEVIDQYLSGGWFNVLHVNMIVDPKNYSRPDTKYREIYGSMISPANYKEITVNIGHVSVNTDSGWLVSNIETKNYVKADISELLQFDPGAGGVLCIGNFQVSQIENQYSRSYKTIQDVLAQAGGLANVGLAVILIVTTPYLNLKFRLSLINELFDIHPLSSDNKKTKNKKGSSKKQRGSEMVSMRNQSGRDNEKDGQGILTSKGELVKSNPTNESLFTVSPQFSPAFSNRLKPNPEGGSSPVRNKTEAFSLQSGYYPLELNSPKSEAEEKVNSFNVAQNTQKEPKNSSLPKFVEFIRQPVQEVETKVPSLRTSHIELELPKIRKTKSKISLYAKKKLEQIDQKNINDTNDDFPNIFDSEEEEVSRNDIENSPSRAVKSIKFQNAERKIREVGQEAGKTDAYEAQVKSDAQRDLENPSRPQNEAQATNRKKLTFTLSEYISSFFWTSPALKQKMDILSEGIRNIDTRLDVISIMKKLREIDKLKAMLLDLDQAVLFNNLPKPEIKPKALKRVSGRSSFSHNLLRKSTFIENDEGEGYNVHIGNIEGKIKKTKMDQRLIAIFKEKKV